MAANMDKKEKGRKTSGKISEYFSGDTKSSSSLTEGLVLFFSTT
jgi:hypothetical protein